MVAVRAKRRRSAFSAAVALLLLCCCCCCCCAGDLQEEEEPLCSDVHAFQRLCDDRDDPGGVRVCTSSSSSSPAKNGTAATELLLVACRVVDGVACRGPRNFSVRRACVPTSGHSFEIAMALSALTGLLGFDRCYLGYPTLGFLKFATCGGFVVWALLDALLVALQMLGPADGTAFVFSSGIPRIARFAEANHTAYLPP